MKTLRLIAWVLLGLSFLLVGHEGLNALEGEPYRLIPLGEWWFRIDQTIGTASLNLLQATIQRHIWPWLWDAVVQNVLSAPSWMVLGIIGMLLMWVGRSRSRRTLTFRS